MSGRSSGPSGVRRPSRTYVALSLCVFRPFTLSLIFPSLLLKVHEGTAYDFDETGQLAYHTWESVAMGYLMKLTPDSLKESQTSFGRMAKK